MIVKLAFGAAFAVVCGSLLFPEEAKRIKAAADRTSEQMAASAVTDGGRLVKGYRNRDDARRHRSRLDAGTVIYLPNGMDVVVKEGLGEIQSDNWWYAWTTIQMHALV